MRIGSLFSGIGGFDWAARWVGWETAWYSEIEPYPCWVMRQDFPQAVNHGDIRQIKGADVEPVDLLCGGFPCQDLSVANSKGKGLDGERSGLWFEYARLIRELRPRWVVIENVPPLLRRGFAVVRGDLRAAGYRVARPVLMSAAFLGAPHKRERLWIVAHRERSGDDDERSESDSGETGRMQGEASQRERLWPDSRQRGDDVGGVGQADANGRHRHQGIPSSEQSEVPGAMRGNRVEQPAGVGRRARWAEHAGQQGGPTATGASGDVGDPESEPQREPFDQTDSVTNGRKARGIPVGASGIPDWSDAVPVRGADGITRLVPESGVCPLAHGVSGRVRRLKGLGNAIVPPAAYVIFRAIQHAEGR